MDSPTHEIHEIKCPMNKMDITVDLWYHDYEWSRPFFIKYLGQKTKKNGISLSSLRVYLFDYL